MDYKELAEKAREIDAKATPGPWMWDLCECNHQCLLTTTHSGKYYVMGFQRWGLQDALPSFQVYDRYEGQMKDRGSHGMVRADKLSKSYPGKEHHYGFDNFIDHPDARYIAESRELFHQMATAITELLSRAEAAEARCETLEKMVKEYQETIIPGYRQRAETAEEIASDLCDDFTDFVTGGIHNAAPYCANLRPECVNAYGLCDGNNRVCRGFMPKAAARNKDGGSDVPLSQQDQAADPKR